MVSLRRKKLMMMDEGGQRRSARLFALELHKHEKAANVVVPTNAEQATSNTQSIGRKRGRKKKVREVYQINNDTESSSRLGDFSTVNKKYSDGMCTTLEQSQNDVYTVVGKAGIERTRGGDSRPRSRRALIETDHLEAREEQRRYTYGHGSASNKSLVLDKQDQLVYNNNAMDYRESVLNFVKDAGPVSKATAEKRCLEYSQRLYARKMYERQIAYSSLFMRPSSHLPPSRFGDPVLASSGCREGGSDDLVLGNFGCQLQTDEVLTLFSVIGTPEFLRRSNSMASSSNQVTGRDKGFCCYV